jgi:hypothetical protein
MPETYWQSNSHDYIVVKNDVFGANLRIVAYVQRKMHENGE